MTFAVMLAATSSFLMVFGGLLLLWASLSDIAARILPDWCATALAVIGLILRLGDGSLLEGACAALAVFAVTAACWWRGWVGGGDVKLLSACALLVAPAQVMNLILGTTLAGGVLALVYLGFGMVLRRRPPLRPAGRASSLVARVSRIERWRIMRHGSLPYGCAIAVAALYVLFAPLTAWK